VGRLVLAVYVLICAGAAAHFVLSAWRSWTWSRSAPQPHREPTPT
jgi:hypothetical protein